MRKLVAGFFLFVLMNGISAPTYAIHKEVLQQRNEFIPPSGTFPEVEEPTVAPQPGVLITRDGEVIGAVVDFIFDLRPNRILYIIVATPLFPGQAQTHVVVLPWEVIQVEPDGNSFILKEDRSHLPKAPNFLLETWPYLLPVQWQATLQDAWREQKPDDLVTTLASHSLLFRASDLVGKTLITETGEEAGALAELLVDPQKGSIVSAIVLVEESSSNNQVLFYPLPWSNIHIDPVNLTLVLSQAY
ncbi:MAG: PRC-barrel domain-containing protein [Candidatus Binatia bacterium]